MRRAAARDRNRRRKPLAQVPPPKSDVHGLVVQNHTDAVVIGAPVQPIDHRISVIVLPAVVVLLSATVQVVLPAERLSCVVFCK